MTDKKRFIIIPIIVVILAGSFFYFQNKIYYSRSVNTVAKSIKIEKGESTVEIAEKLEKENLVSGKYFFLYYVWKNGLEKKIVAGEYSISPGLTIAEIAKIIGAGEINSNQVKITFPEGWMGKDMEARLKNNGLNTTSFSDLFSDSQYFSEKYGYDFLSLVPKRKNLEGFLFPDTYFFRKEATAEEMIKKMLDNFGQKLRPELRDEIQRQQKTIYEVITMASLLEGEVKSEADRKIVSGIFWDRMKNGQALQSCATLAYILGENKKQYSFNDTRIDSPYNTYLNRDLPPGPINSPGMISIRAAVYPTASDYNYFLTDPGTGQTVFSKTIDEHNANKVKYGL